MNVEPAQKANIYCKNNIAHSDLYYMHSPGMDRLLASAFQEVLQ